MSGTGKIAELVRRLQAMSSPVWRAGLSLRLAGTVRGLIDDGYARQRSPYGPWRARKGQYSWPMLQRSGALRHGWRLGGFGADGLRFTNTQDYAVFQQYGTRRGIDPREQVPTEAFGLGSWREPLRQETAKAITDLIRGR